MQHDVLPVDTREDPQSARVGSRSPQPYHRVSISQNTRPVLNGINTSPPPPPVDDEILDEKTARTTLRPQAGTYVVPSAFNSSSESGTEADDEKEIVQDGSHGYWSRRRALPAPPRLRARTGRWEVDDDEIPRGREQDAALPAADNAAVVETKEGTDEGRLLGRKRIVFVRRGLESGLMAVVIGIVCTGPGAWGEVMLWRRELLTFLLTGGAVLALQPLSSLLTNVSHLGLPPALDPSSILYPIFFPPLISISLSPYTSLYLLPTLICALLSIPPLAWPRYLSDSNLRYTISLIPLLACNKVSAEAAEQLLYLPVIHSNLVSLGVELLIPSLSTTETRLLATALVNILFNAVGAHMVIMKTILWGTGSLLLLFCAKLMAKEVELERSVVIARARKTARRRTKRRESKGTSSTERPQLNGYITSDPESTATEKNVVRRLQDVLPQMPKNVVQWQYIYAVPIYLSLALGILFLERPYIAEHAFSGMDPFIWAIGYLLSGLPFYEDLLDGFGLGDFEEFKIQGTEGYWGPNGRLCLAGFWSLVVLTGVGVVITLGRGVRVPMEKLGLEFQGPGWLGLGEVARGKAVEVDTRRKVFHFMVVVMFCLPVYLDPAFVSIALVITLPIFLLLDIFRATLLPPLAKPLAIFLAPYVDGRDLRGPIVVSHVFLLIGCAMPLWLSLAGSTPFGSESNTTKSNANVDTPFGVYWIAPERDLAMIAGVISVGMGDAAASLIGRRFGKHKWGWSGGKSIEGSIAFMVAVAVGLLLGKVGLITGGFQARRNGINRGGLKALKTAIKWESTAGVAGKVLLAGGLGSLVEAVVTGVNDNVALPLILWMLVRGLDL